MIIGFWVTRSSLFKIFGPIMTKALQQDNEVILYYQKDFTKTDKSYLNLKEKELIFWKSQGVRLIACQISELDEAISTTPVDVLITLEGYYTFRVANLIAMLKEISRAGTKLVQIAHFYEVAQQPIKSLEVFDLTMYISEYGRDLHFDLWEVSYEKKQQLLPKTVVVGFPAFDQIGRGDEAKTRIELSISEHKKIVLFTAPVLSPITIWRFVVWRESNLRTRLKRALTARKFQFIWDILTGQSFESAVLAIRKFCDDNDAILIVKSRVKQEDPAYLVDSADIYLSGVDEQYYPEFSTYKLLQIADILITVLSMSAIEAVAANIPVINIQIPHDDIIEKENTIVSNKYYTKVMGGNTGSLFNSAGCVYSIDWRNFSSALVEKTFDDFLIDEVVWQEYSQYYLKFPPEGSSACVIEELEKLVSVK